jgi:anti-anti-sigma factor
VKGSIQHTDTPVFEKELDRTLEAGGRLIVLDLTSVAHICSSALGALISLKRRIRRYEGDVRIATTSGEVLRVLHITLLDRVFQVFENVDAAVNSYQAKGQNHEAS